jgi:prophage tail gpP-like protein
MLKPSYSLEIGSEVFKPSLTSPLISIFVENNIDVPSNVCDVKLGMCNSVKKIKDSDDMSLKFGYEDNLVDVFKGIVDNLDPRVSDVTIKGLNFSSKLLDERVNRVFENQSAGSIVSDLIGIINLDIEEVSDGITFPIYYIDDNKNLFLHIKELALKCGFDFFLTVDNKVVFKKYERSEPHTLEYGKNIINASLIEDRPMVSSVNVQGESPSSFKGSDTYHWLTKKKVEAVEGTGSTIIIQDPSIRDKDSAEKLAKSRLDELSKKLSGTVKIVGDASIKLGDTIEIKGMPEEKTNREFQVRRVEHYLSKKAGFTTTIGWRE